MMDDPIIIETKTARKKGEDGYKVISIRIRNEVLEDLDELAAQSMRSRNDIINRLLVEGLRRAVVK